MMSSEDADPSVHEVIEQLIRHEWGRCLAVLVARINDLHLAEDSLQTALVIALEKWSESGIPDNPRAWLIKVAGRKMIDHISRQQNLRTKVALLSADSSLGPARAMADSFCYQNDEEIGDERLRLMFICCHPALNMESRVALTLQTLGGLKTSEIARAFLVPISTMAQRLVRAKRKIKSASIPYVIPDKHNLSDRISGVFTTLYLIFNEGYFPHAGNRVICRALCEEAIRLTRILAVLIYQSSEHSEALGLLALMQFHYSRADARNSDNNEFVPLPDQNRVLWDQQLMLEGQQNLKLACRAGKPGLYIIQAAISAIHSESTSHEDTDWTQIYLLYTKLLKIRPDPIVILNAAVAYSYIEGPATALRMTDHLEKEPKFKDYIPFHSARADFYKRNKQTSSALATYQIAHDLSNNEAGKRYFKSCIEKLVAIP